MAEWSRDDCLDEMSQVVFGEEGVDGFSGVVADNDDGPADFVTRKEEVGRTRCERCVPGCEQLAFDAGLFDGGGYICWLNANRYDDLIRLAFS